MTVASVRETANWCEAIAHTRAEYLGLHLAVRCLRSRGADVTDQVDRHYAAPGRHRFLDEPEHEQARSALAKGEEYIFRLYADMTCYMLSARPTRRTRCPTQRLCSCPATGANVTRAAPRTAIPPHCSASIDAEPLQAVRWTRVALRTLPPAEAFE